MAILIDNESVPRVICHGEMRTRQSSVGGAAAFKLGTPVVCAVDPPKTIPGNRAQNAKRRNEIAESIWIIGGEIYRQESIQSLRRRRHPGMTRCVCGKEIFYRFP